MSTFIDLILLATVICFIVDCSGVMDEIRKLVAKVIYRRTKINVDWSELKLRPIGCSLCSVWWCGLLYLVFVNEFTLVNVAAVALLSLVSSNISGFLMCVKDFLAALELLVQKLLRKI